MNPLLSATLLLFALGLTMPMQQPASVALASHAPPPHTSGSPTPDIPGCVNSGLVIDAIKNVLEGKEIGEASILEPFNGKNKIKRSMRVNGKKVYTTYLRANGCSMKLAIKLKEMGVEHSLFYYMTYPGGGLDHPGQYDKYGRELCYTKEHMSTSTSENFCPDNPVHASKVMWNRRSPWTDATYWVVDVFPKSPRPMSKPKPEFKEKFTGVDWADHEATEPGAVSIVLD